MALHASRPVPVLRPRVDDRPTIGAERVDATAAGPILAAVDACTWAWNLANGDAAFGDGWEAVLGYGPAELGVTIATMQALFHPGDKAVAERELAGFLVGNQATFHPAIRVRKRDGGWVWLRLRGRLATRLPDGSPEWLVGLAFDDTELHAEEELTRTASHYARSLIEASLDPLVTINVDGRIMDVNRATEAATGRTRQQLIGSDFSDYFTDPDKARDGYRQVFSLGRVVDYPLTLQHASGATMDVLYNASTYHDQDGRVAGVFAAARDVTEVRRTQAALEATNREVTLLSEMSGLLQRCQTLGESIPIVQATLQAMFPRSRGRVFLLGERTGMLEEAVAWGDERTGAAAIPTSDCWALRRDTPHEVGFGSSLAPPCRYLAAETRPYLCIPLLAQGTALGIIHLVAGEPAGALPRVRDLARSVADSIGLSLANIQLRENLQAMSTRDPLTGLYNRRFLEEAFPRELSRAARSESSGVVAMIDIDHFKDYNDTYGHEAGDSVLTAVARALLGFREGADLACRYGGEEFLLVLTDVTLDDAVRRLEHLRGMVSTTPVLHDGKPIPAVTVSVGVAAFPFRGGTAPGYIRLADEALYRAKEGGRDRLESARPSVPPDGDDAG